MLSKVSYISPKLGESVSAYLMTAWMGLMKDTRYLQGLKKES